MAEKTKKRSSSDTDMKEIREEFARCADAEKTNRDTALEDIRFTRLADQWPEDIAKQRQAEGRPCLTIPKQPAFVRQVVNDARQNKPAIKVRPADSGSDPETAEVFNGLIRNIEYTSNADIAYDTATECAVTGGFGYIRVGLDYAYDDSFEMDITVNRVANQFSVYGDPNSTAADSSDWDVAFVVDRLSKAQFKREYPDAERVDWDDTDWSDLKATDWYEDDSVLVAEYWTREKIDRPILLFADQRTGSMVTLGKKEMEEDEDLQMLAAAGVLEFKQERIAKSCKVTQRIMSGLEELKTTDWLGRYIPIIPVYGDEFNIQGKRYLRSLTHNSNDAQRMFNYWRTAATELVALAPRVPFIGPKGAFASDPGWQTANKASHPYLEYDVVGGQPPPQRQPMDTGTAAGALQEALNASDDMKAIMGIYDASLGARSNETSGKAIMARQREGDVSTFHFVDNMARAIRHTGRVLIDLIPKVYNTERIVRVIGEDGAQRAVKINTKEPVAQTDKNGNPMTTDGQPPAPDMSNVVMRIHDLTAGKYDLTVTTGPSFTTRREEAATSMAEAVQAFPASAPVILPELAKNLDWPGADEIAEKLEKLQQPQIPPELQKAIEDGKQQIAKLTEENQNLKMDQQAEQAKIAAQGQADMAKLESQKQIDFAKLQSAEQLKIMEIQSDEKLAVLKIQSEAQINKIKADYAAQNAAEANRVKAENSGPQA